MRTEIVHITPAMAKSWLSANTKNRHARKNVVKQLADVISAGKWELNGSAIRFGLDGRLLDGQHRLLAIVQANVPCPSLVVYDLQDTAFETIDVGGAGARTAGDFLGLDGVGNPNPKAATGLVIAKLDRCTSTSPTASVALDYTRRYLSDIEWVFAFGRRQGIAAAFRGACAWARKIDDAAVSSFAKSVIDNEVKKGTIAHAYVNMISTQNFHSDAARHHLLLRTLWALEVHISGQSRLMIRTPEDAIMGRFKRARDIGKF